MLQRVAIACSYVERNQLHISGGVQVGVVVPCYQLLQSHRRY